MNNEPMNNTIKHARSVPCLQTVLAAVALVLSVAPACNARPVAAWPCEKLAKEADVIVIATPTQTKDTGEIVEFPGIARANEPVPGHGVNTTFEVLAVLKGGQDMKSLVLFHLREVELDAPRVNAPQLVSFDPTKKKRYLMFLKREADGRFSSLCGQTDPAGAIKDCESMQLHPDVVNAWRNAESENLTGLSRNDLMKIFGQPLIWNGEPFDKFADKADLAKRFPEELKRKEVWGFQFRNVKPDASLVVRLWVGEDKAFDAYWSQPGSETLAFFRPPPAAEQQARRWSPGSDPVNGLQCRLLPVEQEVEPSTGSFRDMLAYVTYELQNVSSRDIKFLPDSSPLQGVSSPQVFTVVAKDGDQVEYKGKYAERMPPTAESFITIKPGQTLSRRVGLPYDFSVPGAYRVTARAVLPLNSLRFYYGDDPEQVKANPDNVWTGELESNEVLVDVVPSKGPWGEPTEQGLALRLREPQEASLGVLYADVGNKGYLAWNVLASRKLFTLEVDGKTYVNSGEIVPPDRRLQPGQVICDVPIPLDRSWLAEEKPHTPLKLDDLVGGKHTVRISFIAEPVDRNHAKPVPLSSNPVAGTLAAGAEIEETRDRRPPAAAAREVSGIEEKTANAPAAIKAAAGQRSELTDGETHLHSAPEHVEPPGAGRKADARQPALPKMVPDSSEELGLTFDRPASWVVDAIPPVGAETRADFMQPDSEREEGDHTQASLRLVGVDPGTPMSVDVTSPPDPKASASRILQIDGVPARLTASRGGASDDEFLIVQFAKGTRSYDLRMVYPRKRHEEYLRLALAVCESVRFTTGTIGGHLLDRDGRPVAGATVVLGDEETGIPLHRETFKPFTEGEPDLEGVAVAVTGDAGRFQFDGVPHGTYRLLAQSWPAKNAVTKVFEKNGPEIVLRGVTDDIRVPSEEAEKIVIRPLGDGVVTLDEDFPNSDALLVVSTKPLAYDPILGFASWRGSFLQGMIGANRMPKGFTRISGLPDGEIHLSVFANDNNGGIGAGSVIAIDGETVQAEFIPIVCGWSNGRHDPPANLMPTFKEIRKIATERGENIDAFLDELLRKEGIAIDAAQEGKEAYFAHLDQPVVLPSGRKVRFADVLASALYLDLQPRSGDIHTAAREGDTATVARLLERGVDPNKRNRRNATPLHEAAAHGRLPVVRLLVEHGADVNRRGDTYQKPLHFAAQAGHPAIVSYLLEHGAEISRVLHETAYKGRLEIARLLLKQGADINEKGSDEATPLERAVACGQAELVEFLLAHGADENAQGLYGRTALHVAASRDDVAIGRILLKHGADPALKSNGRPVRPRSEEFRKLLEQDKPAPDQPPAAPESKPEGKTEPGPGAETRQKNKPKRPPESEQWDSFPTSSGGEQPTTPNKTTKP